MNIVLLSGGSGTRLWPLSNDIRSKQFIKILKSPDGEYESMLQRMYRGIKEIDCNSTITIATSINQVSLIKEQLGEGINLSIEPSRRNTFPAIALAAAYLYDKKNISENESVVVCPIDPYVDENYFKALIQLSDQAEKKEANLVLLGIKPTYPSEKYGYIIPEKNCKLSYVETFKEKPTLEDAKKYISAGALWNGGIFAFELKYILNLSKIILGYNSFDELYAHYNDFEKISFDYAVVEKESSIQVLLFEGVWEDIGTWNSLTQILEETCIGNCVIDDSINSHIINDLDIPVVGLGLENIIVSVSKDGILVSNKEKSEELKKYVDVLKTD